MTQASLKIFKSAGLIHRAVDWAFGYDFFISYAHADGLNYPTKLKEKLELSGFKVFLDKAVYVAGEELRQATRRRVSMSRKLVVIGRQAALVSEWVRREVDIHLAVNKTPIIINVNQIIESVSDGSGLAAIARERDWMRIEEQIEGHDADPTDYCVSELIRSFDATRQATKRLRFFGSAAITLVLLTLTSVIAAYFAIQQSRIAKANQQKAIKAQIHAEEAASAEAKAREEESRQRQLAEQRQAEAERQTRISTARRLSVEAQLLRDQYPQRSILLAVESVKATSNDNCWIPLAEQALRDALSKVSGYGIGGNTEYDSVQAMAISPDNHWLVTAGAWDQTAKLWDLNTIGQRQVPIILRGHGRRINKVAISSDNRWLVTTTGFHISDRMVIGRKHNIEARLWDLTAKDPSQTSFALRGHDGGIEAVAISPDNHWLVTGSRDKTARVWDLTAKSPSQTSIVLRGHDEGIVAVKISFDNKLLVTASRDFQKSNKGSVRLWSLNDEFKIKGLYRLPMPNEAVKAIAISPDNRWLVTAFGKTASLWNLKTKHPAKDSADLIGHEKTITSLVIDSESRWLFTGSGDATVRRWDLNAKDPSNTSIILRGQEDTICALAISSNDRWLAAGSSDYLGESGTIRLWDLNTVNLSKTSIVLPGHSGRANSVLFSSDNRWLITKGADESLRLWNLNDKHQTMKFIVLSIKGDRPGHIAISPNKRWLVVCRNNRFVNILDLTAKDISTTSAVLQLDGEGVKALAISPDGHWLVVLDYSLRKSYTFKLWHLTGKDPLGAAKVMRGHYGEVDSVAISSDNHWLVTGSEDKTARLWDLTAKDPTNATAVMRGHNDAVKALAFSPDNHWLVTAGGDRCRLWDLTTRNPAGKSIVLWSDSNSKVTIAGFSTDNRWVITVSDDHAVRLWDLTDTGLREKWLVSKKGLYSYLETVRSVVPPIKYHHPAFILHRHEEKISSIAISDDGKVLATGSHDKTSRLWDLTAKDPAEASIVLHGHKSRINSIAISSDNRWIATASSDNTVRLWSLRLNELLDMAQRVVGRNLNTKEWEIYFPGEPYRKTFSKLPFNPTWAQYKDGTGQESPQAR